MASRAVKESILISATGKMAIGRASHHYGKKGFTLLEIMVVIAIIAIILSFAVIAIDTEPEELANGEKRLTALMKLLSEDSVLNSREHRALFSKTGYGFQRLENGKWLELEDGLFRPRTLPAGFSLTVAIDHEPVLLEEKTLRAAILFLSSGEITPFTITIQGRSGLQTTITNKSGEIATDPAE